MRRATIGRDHQFSAPGQNPALTFDDLLLAFILDQGEHF